MSDRLEATLDRIRATNFRVGTSESATRHYSIDPILAQLGWDIHDINQVNLEYSVGSGRVDYCLQIQERPRIFIEAKRCIEDLNQHQEQLLTYAFTQGVEIAVLTNGLAWWLYLAKAEGEWEQRKFFVIDIESQNSETATRYFRQFLSIEMIRSGEAAKQAEEIHSNKTKQKIIKETLPKAWQQLIGEPDDLLVDLLVEKVEAVCGVRPDLEIATQFLKARASQIEKPSKSQSNTATTETTNEPPHINEPIGLGPYRTMMPGEIYEDFTGQRPRSYRFKDRTVGVTEFKQILIGVLEEIYREQGPTEFRRLLECRGRGKSPFSNIAANFLHPRLIKDSGIYVESNRNANSTIKLCRLAMSFFNYHKDDFAVEIIPSRPT